MMSFSADNLAVVTVNYGSSRLLEQNLAPLSSSAPELLVVIVDNLTSPAERERVRDLARRHSWLTVLPESNTGFGTGMNLGVNRAIEAGATRFLLLNPDARIDAGNLRTLVAFHKANPNALVAPRVLRPDGSVWFNGADLHLRDGRIRSTARRMHGESVEPWLSGACLLVGEDLWGAVEGFRDDYFLYWEDVDLSYRVTMTGADLRLCEEVSVVHAEGGTQGDGHETSGRQKSSTYYYYNIRNRLLFAALNLETDVIRSWMLMTLPIAWEVLLQGGRRQFLRSARPLLAGLRGVRDGLIIAHRESRSRGR